MPLGTAGSTAVAEAICRATERSVSCRSARWRSTRFEANRRASVGRGAPRLRFKAAAPAWSRPEGQGPGVPRAPRERGRDARAGPDKRKPRRFAWRSDLARTRHAVPAEARTGPVVARRTRFVCKPRRQTRDLSVEAAPGREGGEGAPRPARRVLFGGISRSSHGRSCAIQHGTRRRRGGGYATAYPQHQFKACVLLPPTLRLVPTPVGGLVCSSFFYYRHLPSAR
jgi:hypothetical protein